MSLHMSESAESMANTALNSRPGIRPYRWGFFQSAMCLPAGLAMLVQAYAQSMPWRILNSITGVVCLVVCFGLIDKRRYGAIGYYALVALVCSNYARVVTTIALNPHLRFKGVTPLIFLLGSLFVPAWWILPAVFYYPKRWNEFR